MDNLATQLSNTFQSSGSSKASGGLLHQYASVEEENTCMFHWRNEPPKNGVEVAKWSESNIAWSYVHSSNEDRTAIDTYSRHSSIIVGFDRCAKEQFEMHEPTSNRTSLHQKPGAYHSTEPRLGGRWAGVMPCGSVKIQYGTGEGSLHLEDRSLDRAGSGHSQEHDLSYVGSSFDAQGKTDLAEKFAYEPILLLNME